MRFFKEASGFPIAQNWRQNLCRIFFFLWQFFTTFDRDFAFFLIFFFFALLLILHCSEFVFRFNSLHCLKTVKLFILSDFQRRISCHFVEIMVFSNQEKAVRASSYRLLKRFHEDNSMEIRAHPGRQRTITTKPKKI